MTSHQGLHLQGIMSNKTQSDSHWQLSPKCPGLHKQIPLSQLPFAPQSTLEQSLSGPGITGSRIGTEPLM